ncbi:GNAT family N-acetyltransferase [Rhizobium sp. L245/93]|uniref:GNAT family N-acetyltransferase n=1 Tax=Rhizobium sp. L245/93 TaxID=2819998 RepID=UPI001ADCF4FD|nr:GNAT family N-acetyltransferase [Rhizobium sp. L245/93]MBO9168286.1 GNAT family N-acetyltransferase [Rhizobium sp. L245/93]
MFLDVRGAVDEDMEACHGCLAVVAEEGLWLSRLNAPPIDRYASWWESMRIRQAPQAVATVDGRVIGWCDISPLDGPLHAHIGSLGIGIVPGYRGLGLGTRLIALALAKARERELERIELSVLHDNDAAIGLYKRMGFVIEGRRRRDWKLGNVYRDSILMALV